MGLLFGLNQGGGIIPPPSINDLILEDAFSGVDDTMLEDRSPDVWNGPGSTPWLSTGNLKILSNTLVATADSSRGYKVFDDAPIRMVCELNLIGGGEPGLLFRQTDSLNFLLALQSGNVLYIYKREAGSFAVVNSAARTFAGGWYDLEVIADGNDLLVRSGGVEVTATTSFNASAVEHGVRGGGVGGAWRNLEIYQ